MLYNYTRGRFLENRRESDKVRKDLVAVVGYVAANNEGGALYQVISVVDNTGEAHSGIIVKDENFTEQTLPVGTKVIIGLQRATYDLNKGLPQIRKATIYKTDKKADIVVPVIDDSQCADYLGQYVTVKDISPLLTLPPHGAWMERALQPSLLERKEVL